MVRSCLAIGLLSLCAAAGFAQPRPTAVRKSPAPAVRPAAAKPAPASDAEIEKAIRSRLAASKIGADGFQAYVRGGVATLEGRTDVIQHKGVATRLAKKAGAVRVVNRIEVSQAARDRAAANLSQGRRRAQIKRGSPRSAAPEPRGGR